MDIITSVPGIEPGARTEQPPGCSINHLITDKPGSGVILRPLVGPSASA